MNPAFIIIPVVWAVGAFFAWAFVHGAEKLRRQEDATLLAVEPEPLLTSISESAAHPVVEKQTAA